MQQGEDAEPGPRNGYQTPLGLAISKEIQLSLCLNNRLVTPSLLQAVQYQSSSNTETLAHRTALTISLSLQLAPTVALTLHLTL